MNDGVGIGNVAMINNELKIMLRSGEYKVFLQGGFYRNTSVCDYIHIHNYTEIHLAAKGEMVFVIGDEKLTINDKTALIIPGGIPHGCISTTGGAIHTAFQIDIPTENISTCAIEEDLTRYLFTETQRTDPRGDHTAVVAVIALLCSRIFPDTPLLPHYVTDTAYLITDFFSRNYRDDVRLGDLAEMLHLSERQTERLVEERTGRCFRDELTVTRMKMADQLLTSTDMTPTRVAQYVGYRSYAGFWKAYTKYKKGNKEAADVLT